MSISRSTASGRTAEDYLFGALDDWAGEEGSERRVRPPWLWAGEEFYVPDVDGLRPRRFVVFPWVARFLDDLFPSEFLGEDEEGRSLWNVSPAAYSLALYSTIKKSGKTAINGVVCAFLAYELAPAGSSLYLFANVKEQAAGRVFEAVRFAVENNPRLLEQTARILDYSIRLKNGTTIRVSATNAAGSAGANQIYSGWTEIWGYKGEKEVRTWGEMTPPPTVRGGIKFVDTYAGYEEESELLNELEDELKAGERLYLEGYPTPLRYRPPLPSYDADTGELLDDWQPDRLLPDGRGFYEEPLPIYRDVEAGIFGLWDEETAARRVPWQRGARGDAYYKRQKRQLREEEYSRIHRNVRSTRGGIFVDPDLWDACRREYPLWQAGAVLPSPVAFAIDAGHSDDHMALVGTCVDEEGLPFPVVVDEWEPSLVRGDGKTVIDISKVGRSLIEYRNAGLDIAVVGYDPWQLETLALELERRFGFRMFSFGQGNLRDRADTELYTRIKAGSTYHPGDPRLTRAIKAANASTGGNRTDESLRVRIKKGKVGYVDVAVAFSMSSFLAIHRDVWERDPAPDPLPDGFDAWALSTSLPGLEESKVSRRPAGGRRGDDAVDFVLGGKG